MWGSTGGRNVGEEGNEEKDGRKEGGGRGREMMINEDVDRNTIL